MTNVRDSLYLKKFGQHLKDARIASKLTQEQLANDSDIPISQIGRMERGEINPTICTLLVLSRALKITPKELLEYDY